MLLDFWPWKNKQTPSWLFPIVSSRLPDNFQILLGPYELCNIKRGETSYLVLLDFLPWKNKQTPSLRFPIVSSQQLSNTAMSLEKKGRRILALIVFIHDIFHLDARAVERIWGYVNKNSLYGSLLSLQDYQTTFKCCKALWNRAISKRGQRIFACAAWLLTMENKQTPSLRFPFVSSRQLSNTTMPLGTMQYQKRGIFFIHDIFHLDARAVERIRGYVNKHRLYGSLLSLHDNFQIMLDP